MTHLLSERSQNHRLSTQALAYALPLILTIGLSLTMGCDDEVKEGLQPLSPTEVMSAEGGEMDGETSDPAEPNEGGETPNGDDRPNGGGESIVEGGGEAELACEDASDCPETYSCYRGECVPQSTCMSNSDCPENAVCVAGLCLDREPPQGGMTAGQGDLAFDPPALRFTFNMVGVAQTNFVQLINIGETPLHLERLRVEGATASLFTIDQSTLSLPLRLSPQAPIQLQITYTPDDDLSDSAQLIAETEEGVSVLLPMVGETKSAGAAPCLEITPTQLFFGSVPRGQTASREVRLSACGPQAVTVDDVKRGISFFGALPQTFSFTPPTLPLTLSPTQSVSFEVSYTPLRAGLEAGFIEVLSDDPQSPSQRVDLSAIAEPPPIEEVALHIKLNWDTDLTDVDLHLLAPNGQLWTCEGDCFFSNGNPNWGDQASALDDPFLDLDDVDGYGPENINLEAPINGVYKVWVHYWNDHGGDSPEAEIEVFNFGQSMGRFGPSPLSTINEVWEVAEIEFPGFIVTPINQTTVMPRTGLCGGL